MPRRCLLLISLLLANLCFGQYQEYIDSLKAELDAATHDTTRVKLLIKLADEIQDINVWPAYNQQAYDISEANIPTATGRALYVFKEHLAYAVSNQGYKLDDEGKPDQAVELYLKALKLHKEIDCKPGMAACYNNVALILYKQGDVDEAMEYYALSKGIKEELNDIQGLGYWYLNVGSMVRDQGLVDSAIAMLQTSQNYFSQINDLYGVANTYNTLGNIHYDIGNYDSSIHYLSFSLETYQMLNDLDGVAWEMNNIGFNYYKLGQLDSAYHYCESALALAQELGYLYAIESVSENLFFIYSEQEDYKAALEMFRLHVAMRDSLNDVDMQKSVLKQQADFEHEMDILAIEAEQEKKDAVNRIIIWSVSGGLGLTIVFALLMLQRFRITRRQRNVIAKQKKEVEQQKDIIEEKNEEITDSIRYAERIQGAILPPDSVREQLFNDSFVLYLPKDIVSGDFYWMEAMNGYHFCAVVDCTGHGVPGAMVSVMGYNGLNRCIREYKMDDPAGILDKLNDIVTETFAKYDSHVKDGMDMALFRYNPETNELVFAGANNDLWLCRNNEIIILEATHQPIGVIENRKLFENKAITLEPGDRVFLGTDGYADQFGGDRNKKYKSGAMRNFLLQQNGSMEEYGKALHHEFLRWKGDLEQIDDVCVFGFTVE